jgi:hypothetical protein
MTALFPFLPSVGMLKAQEQLWAEIAKAHRLGDNDAHLSNCAADISDHLRYYRLARESKGPMVMEDLNV